jgi:hypothetical protein
MERTDLPEEDRFFTQNAGFSVVKRSIQASKLLAAW